ncbi:hypothetical protein X801_01728 [Opisthorchis viverrini]|uniref:Uncharacterized protein n=1 Tax=Opisthorchis viverrini TaxID=6198 RepID=A0A1S8X6L9_OPIVI|nr:hypothetical protein X801_01728 [Opisthorchis viverrini]
MILPAFLIVICVASRVIGEPFTCYECQNCSLPIKEGTKVSGKTCEKCQIQFKLTDSGKATSVNAACKTSAPGMCTIVQVKRN